jgi:hypothetical protein
MHLTRSKRAVFWRAGLGKQSSRGQLNRYPLVTLYQERSLAGPWLWSWRLVGLLDMAAQKEPCCRSPTGWIASTWTARIYCHMDILEPQPKWY